MGALVILEVRHLRVVQAIQAEGSVSQAARRLNLTQPAVSHALKDLEQRLGVSLFRRDKGMQATSEGEHVLRSAAVVLAELERVEEDLRQFREGNRGVIRIATQCYTCYNWLPPLLKRFGVEYPDIRLEIVTEATNDPAAALLDHRLDIAIMTERPAALGILTQALFEDEFVAILPPGHLLADRAYLKPQDFADQHLINHSQLNDTSIYRKVLGPAGVEPGRTSVIPLTEAIIHMVKGGIGISVMARWMVAPEIDRGDLAAVRVTRGGLHRQWYIATLRQRADSPAMADLIAEIREHAYPAACACRVD